MSLMYSGEDLRGAATKGDAVGSGLALIGGVISCVGAVTVVLGVFGEYLSTPSSDDNPGVLDSTLRGIIPGIAIYPILAILAFLVTRAGLALIKMIKGESSFDMRGVAPALCRASAVVLPGSHRRQYVEEWAGWFHDMRALDEPLHRQLLLACSICRGLPVLAVTLWLGRFRARI